MDKTNVGIVANVDKPEAREILALLVEDLDRHAIGTVLDAATAQLLDEGKNRETSVALDVLSSKVDLLLVLGGDGTILSVIRDTGPHPKPIMGVNIGTLGFLTCATEESVGKIGGWIVNKEYRLSTRTLIEAEVVRGGDVIASAFGLNEAAITRGRVSRVIRLETRIDGEFVGSYSGDGLIVATPTGSTAYSLSAGGPVIDPGSGIFVITPICPHTLTNRSMVVPNDVEIEVIPVEPRGQVVVTLDGQTLQELDQESRLRIRRADHSVQLAFLPDQTFYRTLRQKLRWHGSVV